MKKNILLLESLTDSALEILEKNERFSVYKSYENNNLEALIQTINVHAIITRGIGKVNEELINKLPDLELIARAGVGLDNIDVAYANYKNIPVINAPGSNANTVAEHTIALMLMLQRNLYQALNDVKSGNWAARNTFKSDEIFGKTLGIVGFGNIGSKVAKIAEAFGMKVIYSSNKPKDIPYEHVSLEELLMKSDVISLHLPLSNETKNLINTNTLSLCKPNAILINTSREGLINKDDLISALKNKKIAGYGADVPNANPPNASDDLISMPNVLITAHVSSLTAGTYAHICKTTVQNVSDFLIGNKIDEICINNRDKIKKNVN